MNIIPVEVAVRELVADYEDNDEAGVIAFGGKLDVRPPYQREFVYDDKDRAAVIKTLTHDYPLNVMYWAVREDPVPTERVFEVMDGQQRTISICQYVAGDFSFEGRYFNNLQQDEKDQILDYKLTVYQCSGNPSEKLEWFKIINIAGKELTNQERRNAVYAGPWVTNAKLYFSKSGCPAYQIGNDLMKGSPIRQDYLETVLKWINAGEVEDYMGKHQSDPNATPLWLYYQKVMAWVRATFPNYRKEMKGLPWGDLYNEHGERALDAAELETRVKGLMTDGEVERRSGIYAYVLDANERHLSLRLFSDADKRQAYERQSGICAKCGKHFKYEEMAGDHIVAWSKGGKTVAENCQMLCAFDNGSKGNN